MKYILSTLKELAIHEAENQNPKLSLGVGVMTNFGRNYSFLIRDVYSPQEDIDAFLRGIISSGESRVSVVVCVTPEGEIAYPPRALCTSLDFIDSGNSMGVKVFCPEEDGTASAKYLSTLLRIL